MRYELDILDRANAYCLGTVLENNPTYRIFLDEEISLDRLKDALSKAFERLPYMKSRIQFDGRYYLEDNPEEFPIFNCRFEERPLKFGKATNGYDFLLSFFGNEIAFDWVHVPTDGKGFLTFVREVLAAYYGIDSEINDSIYKRLPVGENYLSNPPMTFIQPQAPGFDPDRLNHVSPQGTARCTIIKVPVSQVLSRRKSADATPAAIISNIIAQTFRKHLKKDCAEANNNVRGKIVVSTRGILKEETIHNCYLNTFITYTDAFDHVDFNTACSAFRSILDLASQEESVLYDIMIQNNEIERIESNPNLEAARSEVKAWALERRKTCCNFNFSYLGVLPFGEEIMDHIVDFQGICINENSDFGVFAYSFNDSIFLTICENYVGCDMIGELIATAAEYDIEFTRISESHYRQVSFC